MKSTFTFSLTTEKSASYPAGALFGGRALRFWLLALPLAIVVLALVLRTIRLDQVPYGFFCDEATHGLDAQLLGLSGHDTNGQLWPLFPRGLGQYRGGLHTYFQLPLVAWLGLSVFSVRLGSALVGTLTIWLLYLYLRRVAGYPTAIVGAFLLATSPWHILQSRIGWDVVGLPLVTLLFLLSLEKGLRQPRWLPLAGATLALGFYSYFPVRIFLPLLSVAILIIYAPLLWHPRRRIWFFGALAVATVLLLPVVATLLDGRALARLQDFGEQPLSTSQRAALFFAQYKAHFLPSFLLQELPDPVMRHSVRGYGVLYSVTAPFLVIGLLTMLRRRRRSDWLFLAWLLIYPVAASLVGPPVSTRSITGVLVLQIAIAMGITTAAKWLWRMLQKHTHLGQGAWAGARRRATLICVCGLLLSLVSFSALGWMRSYLVEYPLYSSGFWGWQWGARPIAAYFDASQTQYDQLFFDSDYNEPNELLRFFASPQLLQSGKVSVVNVSDSMAVKQQYMPRKSQLWAVSVEA